VDSVGCDIQLQEAYLLTLDSTALGFTLATQLLLFLQQLAHMHIMIPLYCQPDEYIVEIIYYNVINASLLGMIDV